MTKKSKPKKIKTVVMVRQYAATQAVVRKKDARAALGLTQGQIDASFDRLIATGELTRLSRGVYKWIPTTEKKIPDVQEKIWRAMRAKRVFSASDMAMLADTAVEYVYKLFRAWRSAEYIKQAGVRPTYGSGEEKLWRLTVKGQDQARSPELETFVPDQLVMDTVNLNRLVCSGMVKKDEASARHAAMLCNMILREIEEELQV